ncbi:hypothetical protein BG015_004602 [Linnemannia schmuckeri]|uniref:F-box domain-containing protein n=1 Tax=Linnemannia schmuckeri TaxID=64567 RepID=A0A9P5RCZ0_9FUNG|nr:hypothetical protein BG015_004602 [Linnemannia schmuckeri]
MPHIIETRPSTTGPTTAGIGIPSELNNSIHTISTTSTTTMPTPTTEGSVHDSGVDSLDDYDSDSDYLYTSSDDEQVDFDSSATANATANEVMTPDQLQHFQQLQLEQRERRRTLRQEIQQRQQRQRRRRRRDVFSTLPAPILQQILARLPPFQMLIISELSRRFYNFVVLGQEMNEVWFRLVKHEEAEEKKRLDWYKLKKLEQEHRSVQMLRSYSNSSTSSNMSSASYGNGYGPTDEHVPAISKQAQRLLNKKQEAASGKSTSTVKAMRRNDRKKNWCKIYVDTILRGNGEDPLQALNQIACGPAQRPAKFQTLALNEPLPLEHYRNDAYKDADNGDKVLSREARTQAKLDKRMYYKSIRSKPKGKKARQMDSAAAKIDKISSWRQPEWTPQDQLAADEY